MSGTATVGAPAAQQTQEPSLRRLTVRARLTRPAWWAALASALAVLFAHFRPWQGGLLEEWGIVQAWQAHGFAAYLEPASLAYTLGRPLHLLPAYLALEVSGGSFVGLYGALAAAGVAQLLLTYWGLAPTGASAWLRWALGLAVAMHPWWSAGYALRYLPAQIAITLCVLWLGATLRWLHRGQRRWLAAGFGALLAAFLIYQAPAFGVLLGMAALVVLSGTPARRLMAACGATLGAVAVSGVWAVFVAPRLAVTYERTIVDGGDITPLAAARAVLRTTVLLAPGVLAFGVLTAIVVIALGFRQALSATRAWLLLAMVGAAPAAALIFYPGGFHLNSPEHISLTVGLALWLLLCTLSTAVSGARPLRLGLVVLLTASALAAGVYGYAHWGAYASAQQSLLDDASRMRTEVAPDEVLVASDRSGYFGSLYLFLPPHLDVAMQVQAGPGPETVLCTDVETIRQPGVATPGCDAYLTDEAELLGTGQTDYGVVDFYAVRRP